MRTAVIFVILCILTGLHIKELTILTGTPFSFVLKPLDPIIPIYKDQEWARSLRADIASDPSGNTLIITRMVHNKLTAIGELATIFLFRPLDPAFIFSFPGPLTIYDGLYKPPMLYPIELPLFLFAVFLFFTKTKTVRDGNIKVSCIFVGAALLFLFTTSPAFHPVKSLIIGIGIRYFTLSVYTFHLWQKFKPV